MRAHRFIYFLIKVTMIGLGFRLFSLIHHTAAHLEAEPIRPRAQKDVWLPARGISSAENRTNLINHCWKVLYFHSNHNLRPKTCACFHLESWWSDPCSLEVNSDLDALNKHVSTRLPAGLKLLVCHRKTEPGKTWLQPELESLASTSIYQSKHKEVSYLLLFYWRVCPRIQMWTQMKPPGQVTQSTWAQTLSDVCVCGYDGGSWGTLFQRPFWQTALTKGSGKVLNQNTHATSIH